MDVKTICLGLLSLGDACGYDLKKHFESLFRHFFSAGYGSIYPALADLAESGMVRCQELPQQGRPARKIYSITELGREHFRSALLTQNPTHKLRSDFLVMMYFADQLDRNRLQDLLDQRVSQFRAAAGEIETAAETSPQSQFVAGFSRALATTAAQYLEDNRHLIEGEAQTLSTRSYRNKNTHEVAMNLEERL